MCQIFSRDFLGDLLKCKFEIIVTLIGVTEETGNTIQVRLIHIHTNVEMLDIFY